MWKLNECREKKEVYKSLISFVYYIVKLPKFKNIKSNTQIKILLSRIYKNLRVSLILKFYYQGFIKI